MSNWFKKLFGFGCSCEHCENCENCCEKEEVKPVAPITPASPEATASEVKTEEVK